MAGLCHSSEWCTSVRCFAGITRYCEASCWNDGDARISAQHSGGVRGAAGGAEHGAARACVSAALAGCGSASEPCAVGSCCAEPGGGSSGSWRLVASSAQHVAGASAATALAPAARVLNANDISRGIIRVESRGESLLNEVCCSTNLGRALRKVSMQLP